MNGRNNCAKATDFSVVFAVFLSDIAIDFLGRLC